MCECHIDSWCYAGFSAFWALEHVRKYDIVPSYLFAYSHNMLKQSPKLAHSGVHIIFLLTVFSLHCLGALAFGVLSDGSSDV
jgi:hypothetical protein